MKRLSLYFSGPEEVEVREEKIEPPRGDSVLVENEFSAISSGTEMLFYLGRIEEDTIIDKGIGGLEKKFDYPFKYGYSSVGKVKEVGKEVSEEWKNKLVFSFHPHESRFITKTDNLIPIPSGIESEEAVFLPSIETAINLLMDGRPLIGENVLMMGQGIIGLLTTSLLNEMPLSSIVTSDRHQLRREMSEEMGAELSIKAEKNEEEFYLDDGLPDSGADLTYEITGNSDTLERAIRLTGLEGRIVIGSWYGDINSEIKLGTQFHRKRLKLISSQVSRINPEYSGRWDKERRLDLAWEYVRNMDLRKLITHEFSLKEAKKAYNLIEKDRRKILQAVFKY
ncbi:hypothetical protein AKJ52_01845 [candidate division MSBL1 archaeon SCGC-AAA382C18]|uniref:Alcohol dehydrogenase-like C-terminal domain-containing protein n=1 Tax=candidate division MSBL1 archaeon SCGC-AAA382C18 TaxID=1698281 RepID=A0A133VJR1_9EURY|nr:hypothetical protein AKJ52_01845 [candidate division MSBL1 archaeon SCGC-AAA382C18]